VKRILTSRAYGRFDFKIFKTILLPSGDSSYVVKIVSLFIATIPRGFFRWLYITYILIFRGKHTTAFSPKLALASLQKKT
jgi:hypothetical protein